MKNLFMIIITSLFLVNCNNTNPMIKQWSDKNSEYGGVPAFDKMSPKLVKEAMLKGMEMSLIFLVQKKLELSLQFLQLTL